MGKCASKQPVSGLNEFGSSPYLAICNDDDIIFINVGQSESKKSSKKAAGLETKGTAMSFGFKKHKIHQSTTGSKLPLAIGDGTGPPGSGTGTLKKPTQPTTASNGNHLYGGVEKEKAAERDNATVISNPGVEGILSDKNGNMGSEEQTDDGTTKATGRSTPRLQPPKKDSYGAPYRNNRFGFRSTNVVRPASAGLQPKTITDYDKQHSNNNNNIHTTNNNNVYITDKRRSKSASAAAASRTTFTPLQQAPSQAQQERSSALQHTGGFGALHKPLPKYQSAHGATKIASSESGAQQVMTKYDQAEHKNTSHNLPSNGGSAATSGSADEQRSQSSVNNANGRQCVSVNDSNQQQHVAANSLTKQEPASSVAKFTLHSHSLPKPQYPVPISLPSAAPRFVMDPKGAKQAANVSRKGTLNQYQRELSSEHALDLDLDESNPDVDTTSNIRMPRQRYRNLEMVLNGRHKFEVRDLETLTAEPIVSLALPQLPSAFNTIGQQQQPVPLSGLVRSSELLRQLSDDIDINDNRYESSECIDPLEALERKGSIASSDVESFEEEKLARDNNSSEKSLKGAIIKDLAQSQCSKTSSPGSSRASWCNAGESMAAKECSSLSLSSSDECNGRGAVGSKLSVGEQEDISTVTITAGNPSLLSSFSAAVPMDISTNLDSVSEVQNSFNDNTLSDQPDSNKIFRSEEYKFAEMAAAVGDAILLDDETSPTDSLVSSCTESDDARKQRKKVVEGKSEREKEKDIDEISPELEELASPVTPGTPTHASNSLSLSDGGRDFLIDDEIADQPELVFDDPVLNESSMIDLASIHLNINEDTPTLRDSISSMNNNVRSLSKSGAPVPKPRKIMAETYESPASIRKTRTRLSRAESLDTLSPCDSITSDDFMLDFNSSMDSIDRPPRSNASGSASALHSLDELQLWSELENKGGQLMHEWSKLLRSQRNSNNNTSRESITSQLPARATRLLTRRLQNNATPTNCGTGGSDSPRSMDSLPRRTALSASYKTATLNQFNNNINNNADSASTATNSAEDLTLLDKSLRNSMLQDVVHFKKQLVRLRRILQETDTLNPFENNNGQFFTTATTTTTSTVSSTGASGETGATSVVDSKQQENTLIKESGVVALALLEDQRQELADLRRQVVYLQGEITAKDRTIRQQQNLIEKYEAEREKLQAGLPVAANGTAGNGFDDKTIDTISTATQTERLRPLSFGGQEGLASRSEPHSPLQAPTLRNGLRSSANSSHHHHHVNGNSSSSNNNHSTTSSSALINSSRGSVNQKPKTQISSVYTQLSSIKHSNHHHHHQHHHHQHHGMGQKRSSLGSTGNLNHIASASSSPSSTAAVTTNGSSMKTVRTTLIGNVLTSSKLNQNSSVSSPPPSPPANGTKLLKTSVRTQMNGGNGLITSAKLNSTSPSNKRTSAIKPPSSFATSNFPAADSPIAHKSKSAPVTPMAERVPATPPSPSSPLATTPNVQIVIETVEAGEEPVKANGCHYEQQNGGSSRDADDTSDRNNNNNNGNGMHDDDDDKEQIAETEKEAINNKINSLKLANGLTGCNDSSCKESSLVI